MALMEWHAPFPLVTCESMQDKAFDLILSSGWGEFDLLPAFDFFFNVNSVFVFRFNN